MPEANDTIESRVQAKATALAPPAEAGDFMSMLMELLAALLESCLSPTPAKLARMLKNPSALNAARLKSRATKTALRRRDKFADPYETGQIAAQALLDLGKEASEQELVDFINKDRAEALPDFDLI